MDNIWTWTPWEDNVSETIMVCGCYQLSHAFFLWLPSLGPMRICTHADEVIADMVHWEQFLMMCNMSTSNDLFMVLLRKSLTNLYAFLTFF